ncbi:MAG: polyribonucleotide nucleotidyltransferase [Candidatus Magasanikbacteria bacterium RIFOXYD2_FULL_41_14]|uniref:Polyribonucleotide nucleotidyltransferase n=1 Tax=Candidatus Magasanikbacteria bacterium RIFOXYD2_FULL_41_14 TaxID=1798709 RepID=A0A1F6PC65_9BACT|nr:MAG: polyribonucleotide nucleotidyltransferase [Candidatus Magasanikbacteria bacterium RIFOXYD2_FULL_41_14]
MDIKDWSTTWAGRKLTVEVGRLALQTNASCTVRYGDTVILATAVMSQNIRPGLDFFPLMVNFEEKFYAAGKIKGSRFIKREGRPTEDAILSGRLVDRAIRPLFDERLRNDVQVILTALSYDSENDPQVPAMIAASVALSISNLPWDGPISVARVGRIDGKLILNPTVTERTKSDFDVVVAGSDGKVVMAEAGANDVADNDVLAAIKFGADSFGAMVDFIKKIQAEVGEKKLDLSKDVSEAEQKLRAWEEEVIAFVGSHADDWIFDAPKPDRRARVTMVDRFTQAVTEMLKIKEADADATKVIIGRVKIYVEQVITERILDKGQRLDSRALDQIRPLNIGVSLLPRTHGSGMFMRGDTQVLSVVTLGAPGDVQTIDTMSEDSTKRYMHHYNDTPATYGEAGPLRGAGNRSIGHGALAERALEPVLPDQKTFPYAMRVVSEVLGSNGSSSMASTCGSTLSLMDAGVPIKKMVAGIALGLASDDKGRYKILTDLQDVEDGPGGMDFKITGTKDGITAIQMDTKTTGLSWEIVQETFAKSKIARLEILAAMEKVIATPRAELSQYAPRIEIIQIDPEKIRDVIGPGGKMINKIIAETGVDIDIEQDGSVFITAHESEGMVKAKKWIHDLTHDPAPGEQFEGTVMRIEDFGAFVEIIPGKDGMVHVSDIAWERTNSPRDVLKIGDKVKVVVKEVDNLGRINLSMKALLPKPEGFVEPPPFERRPPRQGGFSGGGHGGGHGGGRRF